MHCKDNANERNVSLLTDCRVQLIFCKDNAKRRQRKIFGVEIINY